MSGLLTKPNLRGQLNRNIARSLISAAGISFVVALIYKFTVADPKKQKYAEFYKNYDPLADWRHMRDKGLLQSAAPGEE